MSHTVTTACYVHQVTTAVPQRFLDQQQARATLQGSSISRRSERLLQRLTPLTGIQKRHLAVLDYQSTMGEGAGIYRSAAAQPAGPGMGVRTALFDHAAGPLVGRVLEDFSGERLARIKTLITVSCTHAASPGLERHVFAHAAVPRSVDRWHLGFMGCSAALAGMRLVQRSADPQTEALLVACELSSLHFQYTDRIDQMTANLLFADGAAAMLMSSRPSGLRVIDCQSITVPEPADQMLWFAGDHGMELQLSPQLPDTLGRCLPQVAGSFLRRNELTVEAIDHWVVHPGGPQIIDSVQQSLELPAEAMQLSRGVLQRYGNMSSPTVLFIVKALMERNPRGRALALAFGPGLTIELALLEFEGP